MVKVKFNRTISHAGKFYLRGSERMLDEETARILSGRYEVLEREKRAAKSTAVLSPEETTVVDSPAAEKAKKGGKGKKKGGKKAKKGGKGKKKGGKKAKKGGKK